MAVAADVAEEEMLAKQDPESTPSIEALPEMAMDHAALRHKGKTFTNTLRNAAKRRNNVLMINAAFAGTVHTMLSIASTSKKY